MLVYAHYTKIKTNKAGSRLIVGLKLAKMMKFPHIENDWGKLKLCVDLALYEMSKNPIILPSTNVCEMLIVGEDHRFHSHYGVDPIAIIRACWRTFFCGRTEGGSTIAMQLVRTLTGQYDRTGRRKIIEIALSIRLTKHVPPEFLTKLYLWVAYFGTEMDGYLKACERIGINPSSPSIWQAAELISHLKYPRPANPSEYHKQKIQIRNHYLLTRRQHFMQIASRNRNSAS